VKPLRGAGRRFEGFAKPVDERQQSFKPLPGLMLREGSFGAPPVDGARLNVQRLRELGLVQAKLPVEFIDACGEPSQVWHRGPPLEIYTACL
jgi:hypothetical protein